MSWPTALVPSVTPVPCVLLYCARQFSSVWYASIQLLGITHQAAGSHSRMQHPACYTSKCTASKSPSSTLHSSCGGSMQLSMPVSMPSAPCSHQPRRIRVARAVDNDLDWEPEATKPGPLTAPSSSSARSAPPRPPPRNQTNWWEAPFTSRRNIALTMLAGSAGLWLLNNKAGPIQFADKPDIPFKLLGYTDLQENDFVYFKTAGGNWLAAAEDESGRLFMIDEIGDLYYDSGDPEIGLYAMDTQGNLFNFYNDIGGERKITPVGNIRDLQSFKISELAGVKLDRDINVVAFRDGQQIPLPPGTGYMDENGKFIPPGELVEGYTRSRYKPGNALTDLFFGQDASQAPPNRFEVDLNDPTPFQRQMFDQILLDDPTLPGYQPSLPDDFDLDEFAKQVEKEDDDRKGFLGRRWAPRRQRD